MGVDDRDPCSARRLKRRLDRPRCNALRRSRTLIVNAWMLPRGTLLGCEGKSVNIDYEQRRLGKVDLESDRLQSRKASRR